MDGIMDRDMTCGISPGLFSAVNEWLRDGYKAARRAGAKAHYAAAPIRCCLMPLIKAAAGLLQQLLL
jgi:hypothetical protein